MKGYTVGFWLLTVLAMLFAVLAVVTAPSSTPVPEPTYTRCDTDQGRLYCISGTKAFWEERSL